MEQATIQRGEVKLYLADGKESMLNSFIDCRDGIIYRVKYRDCSGYGTPTEAFYCINSKHETVALIVQQHIDGKIYEDCLYFDSDSFREFEKLFTHQAELYRTY